MKSLVGYSLNKDSFMAGIESCQQATKDLDAKIGFLYTSMHNNIKQVVKGVESAHKMPLIGSTSSNGIIIPDGFINSDDGYAGLLTLDDPKLTVGVAAATVKVPFLSLISPFFIFSYLSICFCCKLMTLCFFWIIL